MALSNPKNKVERNKLRICTAPDNQGFGVQTRTCSAAASTMFKHSKELLSALEIECKA